MIKSATKRWIGSEHDVRGMASLLWTEMGNHCMTNKYQERWQTIARLTGGTVIATIVAIIILKIGDAVLFVEQPSRLYQLGDTTWPASIPWWFASGAAIGLIAGVFSFRANMPNVAFAIIPLTTFTSAFILGTVVLRAAGELSFVNVLEVWAFDGIFYTFVAAFPAFLVSFITVSLLDRPRRRSIEEILPDELKRQHEQQAREHADTRS
jgi:hypothetical protein